MNARKIAFLLLVYTCVFVLDDTPFTSMWDNLPQVEVEELLCAEEQEESLAIVTFLKTRLRPAFSARLALSPPNKHFAIAANLTRKNSSLQIQSSLAALSHHRELSVNYCVFRI